MIFPFTLNGIPCQVEVTLYQKALPMRIWGSGMGDCDPPEPEEFEFRLLDRRGYAAAWLEDKRTPVIDREIYAAFQQHLEKLKYEEP